MAISVIIGFDEETILYGVKEKQEGNGILTVIQESIGEWL